jgi:succinate dehydrogenase / fumarate reductase membrane anchor subunit
LATLIWRTSWRISAVTAGRPQRCFDFHRQYDLNPARCQRITVSGRTIASAPYILGNSRQTPPNIDLSIETNRSLLGLARRSTLICCLSTRISASSATRDRNRSLAIPKINRHKSSIGHQHRAILSQLPARLNLRQGQVALVPLCLWFVASIIAHAGSDYAVFIAWIRTPLATSCMILLLIALFHHSALGLQVVIEDYVHSVVRFVAIIAVRLGCNGLAGIGIIATLRIAFGG